MPSGEHAERKLLLDLSARIGRNALLVQASTGNTSVKIGGILWIKSSGTWLAHADQTDILVPVNLQEACETVEHDHNSGRRTAKTSGIHLRASIETAMHAVLPHRVVVHVHSINTIAWAIREDAVEQLAARLAGIDWQWIPYVESGIPLARQVKQAVARAPQTNVLILGNHGLVVCGETCESAEATLAEVDRRLALTPRNMYRPDCQFLSEVTALGPWMMPEHPELHVLGTDPVCRSVLAGGILYPCQAIFWNAKSPVLFSSLSCDRAIDFCRPDVQSRPFLIIRERGVVVRQGIDRADYAILLGLAHVAQRTDPEAPIRYLTKTELQGLDGDAGNYRALAISHANN